MKVNSLTFLKFLESSNEVNWENYGHIIGMEGNVQALFITGKLAILNVKKRLSNNTALMHTAGYQDIFSLCKN